MSKKLVVYKKEVGDNGVVRKTPLRNIQVHSTFVGIGNKGEINNQAFLDLAHDLELGEASLGIDVLNI